MNCAILSLVGLLVVASINSTPADDIVMFPEYENRNNTDFHNSDLEQVDAMNVFTDLLSIDSPPNDSSASDVRFFCLNSRNRTIVQIYANDTDLSAKLDVRKPMAFVVHGWMDRFFSSVLYANGRGWPVATIEDWARFADTNACGVDWSPLAGDNYIRAALANTRTAAYWLARFCVRLKRAGIPPARITIAGHSLGAQIAGYVGKNVQLWTGQQLGTIFGLDPAGPLFTFPVSAPPQDILNPNDAQFVQIIHTAAFTLGVALFSGEANAYFVANGGVYQPGCLRSILMGDTFPLICSHYRSVQYFRFALNPRNRFIGYSCPAPGVGGLLGLLGMWRRDCPVAPAEDRFGIYTQRRGGRFDLKTTSMPPYCVGCS